MCHCWTSLTGRCIIYYKVLLIVSYNLSENVIIQCCVMNVWNVCNGMLNKLLFFIYVIYILLSYITWHQLPHLPSGLNFSMRWIKASRESAATCSRSNCMLIDRGQSSREPFVVKNNMRISKITYLCLLVNHQITNTAAWNTNTHWKLDTQYTTDTQNPCMVVQPIIIK